MPSSLIRSSESYDGHGNPILETKNTGETITWQKYYDKCRDLLRPAPRRLQPVQYEDFCSAMQDLSSARAVARCGCRVSELKAFPRSIIDSHCEVFVFIEEGADWPAELMDVHVHASALRKTSSAAPDEGGEDSILPPAAKTRIINNSPP